VTTEWVLTEVADAAASPELRGGFKEFFHLLEDDEKVEVIPASREGFRSGLKLYFERPDKEWSLTDCISFVVMREQDLTDALTGDRHFEQAGFVALLK
jgi:predicted nucleic acid-binding protein